MEKSLWLWGPLYQASIKMAQIEYDRSIVERHIAVDGGLLAQSSISTKESWTSIGDGDSTNASLDICYPQDKAQSDLALALEYIKENDSSKLIRAFGFSGERLDHDLIGLACFKRHLDAHPGVQARIDHHCLALSPGDWRGYFKASTVSILTLEDTCLSLEGGWKWPLQSKLCKTLDDLLLSNQCDGSQLKLSASKSVILWSPTPIESWWTFGK